MYCTVDDIISASKSFSFFNQHKIPDRVTLENIGETVSSEIDGYLSLYGYPLPLEENTPLYKFVAALNVQGIIAQLMEKLVPMDARTNKNVAEERYLEGLKLLKERHYIKYSSNFQWEEEDKVW